MATKGRMFAGCTVALVTPFREGELDIEAMRRSVDWQIAQGTPVLSPVGTTGESPTLSHAEHERAVAPEQRGKGGFIPVRDELPEELAIALLRLPGESAEVAQNGRKRWSGHRLSLPGPGCPLIRRGKT